MKYDFKAAQELLWAAGIAAFLVVLQALYEFNAGEGFEFKTWVIAVAGGAIRAAAGAVLARRASA